MLKNDTNQFWFCGHNLYIKAGMPLIFSSFFFYFYYLLMWIFFLYACKKGCKWLSFLLCMLQNSKKLIINWDFFHVCLCVFILELQFSLYILFILHNLGDKVVFRNGWAFLTILTIKKKNCFEIFPWILVSYLPFNIFYNCEDLVNDHQNQWIPCLYWITYVPKC